MKHTKPITRVLIGFFVMVFVCISSASEIPADSIQVKYYFNPIVKTATKVSHAQRDIAASISVIESDMLENTNSFAVLDIVKTYTPGFYLTEWGIMGFGVAGSSAGKVSIRGIGGTADTHVLILRNGRPDCMGLMGCTIADEFALDGVERIEVIRGPASFLYGSNASAGVINIISKKMEKNGFETKLNAGYGAFHSQKIGLIHSGKIRAFDYQITVARRKTDGHRSDGKNNYEGNFYTARLGYEFNKNTSLEINGSFADIYLFDPGLTSTPVDTAWYDIKRWGGDITLNHNGRLGDSYLKLHGNFGKHKFADGWNSDDQMLGVMAYHNFSFFSGNIITAGFDWKRFGGNGENLTPDDRTGNPSVPYQKKHVTEYAPYIHVQQLFLKRLIGSAGLRFENNSLFGAVMVPKVGLVAHLTRSTSFRASASKGFRSPSVRELYFFPSYNEDLKPDEVWNIEIGWNQQVGQRLNFEMAVFQLNGENLITLNKRESGPGYQLVNAGKIENRGYEVMLHWLPFQMLELGGSFAYVDMKNPIPNAPERKLTAYANYRFGRFTLTGDVQAVQDWISKDSATPVPKTYPMDDYLVLNFSMAGPIYGPVHFRTSLKNALDTHYEAMYGYPMPGRMLFFDIHYDF